MRKRGRRGEEKGRRKGGFDHNMVALTFISIKMRNQCFNSTNLHVCV